MSVLRRSVCKPSGHQPSENPRDFQQLVRRSARCFARAHLSSDKRATSAPKMSAALVGRPLVVAPTPRDEEPIVRRPIAITLCRARAAMGQSLLVFCFFSLSFSRNVHVIEVDR